MEVKGGGEGLEPSGLLTARWVNTDAARVRSSRAVAFWLVQTAVQGSSAATCDWVRRFGTGLLARMLAFLRGKGGRGRRNGYCRGVGEVRARPTDPGHTVRRL